MESSHQDVLTELAAHIPSSTRPTDLYRDWFAEFDTQIQGWFCNIRETIGGETDFPVQRLPHVSAFLGYVLTRIYERQSLNKKDKDNDLFDRAYFTDAAVVDLLVTNDNSFGNTARRVPHRTFEIVTLDEFAELTDKWHTA